MAEVNHRVAMRIVGNQRRQLLLRLSVSEAIKLDGIILRIEVCDRFGPNAWREYEIVVAWSANGDRHSLVHIQRRIMGIGNAHVVGLVYNLSCSEMDLVIRQ